MKRLAALALMAVWVALPAYAQRNGPRCGAPFHAGPGVHGGFRGPAPSRFGGAPRYAPGRSPSIAHGISRGGTRNIPARLPNPDFRRRRMPYRPPHRERTPYIIPEWNAWVSPYLLGYPDSFDNEDSRALPSYSAQQYESLPDDQDQGEPRLPYAVPYGPSSQMAIRAPVQESEEAVTLIFKDGRPAEQVHNYLMTSTKLFVLDQRRRDIPLDQLDLAATTKENRDMGLDFRIPDGPR